MIDKAELSRFSGIFFSIERSAGPLVIFLSLGLFVLHQFKLVDVGIVPGLVNATWATIFLLVSVLLTRPFLKLKTGNTESANQSKEDEPGLAVIFRIGYVYIFLVLAFCLWLVSISTSQYLPKRALPNLIEITQQGAEEYISYPIMIVEGCVSEDAKVCSGFKSQWVVVFGGSILSCEMVGDCDIYSVSRLEVLIDARSELAAFKQQKKELQKQVNNCIRKRNINRESYFAKQTFESVSLGVISSQESKVILNEDNCNTIEKAHPELTLKIITLSELVDSLAELRKSNNVNIGGQLISGGIVVPLYFVLLTLFGALISMTRKIPEYQLRASQNYRIEYDAGSLYDNQSKTPISPAQAREFVIFQCLQVLSAPIISVVAFSFADPTKLELVSLLGFGVGYSTELFLITVRGILEKILILGPTAKTNSPIGNPIVKEKLVKEIKNTIITEFPAWTFKPFSLTPFVVGDGVRLVKAVGVHSVGAVGTISSIDSNGGLTVKIAAGRSGQNTDLTVTRTADYFVAHVILANQNNTPKG